MIVGFTGTRQGMTLQQKAEVIRQVSRLRPERVVHGDCVGADADFDRICKELQIERSIRPCTFKNLRAYRERHGAAVLSVPKSPMTRNRAIVADADVLLACPQNYVRMTKGSGTWATIRFGEKAKIDVRIIFPDGTWYATGPGVLESRP